MGLLKTSVHITQLAFAITACVFYVSTYDGIEKDYRWKFAITTSAFTITGSIIQGVFIGCFPQQFSQAWIFYSGFCSGILFLFWTGVLGTFAQSFSHLDPAGNPGIRMMQIAVYIDAVNMVIWFTTVAYMMVMMYLWETRRERRATALETRPSEYYAATGFVPYGWGSTDVEAQNHDASSLTELLPPPPAQHIAATPAEAPVPLRPIAAWPSSMTQVNSGTNSPPLQPLQRNISWRWSIRDDEPVKTCAICDEERPRWTGFPSRIAKSCSNHEQEACRGCIAVSIAVELESNLPGQIHCLECHAVLEYEEVKELATWETFDRYVAMGLRSFVSKDPNFIWCQSPNCQAGQEHVGGVDQPIVTCQACGFKTCFKHQIPWHQDMLCDEYDARIPVSDPELRLRAQQELASVAEVREVTKPCGNKECRAPILKAKGCDHMTCWACKFEFCWVCGEKWSGNHRPGCPYGK